MKKDLFLNSASRTHSRPCPTTRGLFDGEETRKVTWARGMHVRPARAPAAALTART